jgi:CD209 antigen
MCLLDKMPSQEIRNTVVVFSFTVSADGPDYVSLWTQPYFFAGVLTADIGSSVQLECNCFSKPEPRYHWIHNGSFLSIPENNMTLPSLSWEQMGSYRCVVENPETQLTFYRDVTIQPPRECNHHALQTLLPMCFLSRQEAPLLLHPTHSLW